MQDIQSELTPLQLPLAPARGMLAGAPQLCCDPSSNRGRACIAPPLLRGGWEGFKLDEQPGLIRKNPQRGFTLIELLVALVILAVISVAGYRSLDAVLQTRERVAAETRKWQHLAFFFARLNQDLAQVVQRPVRDEDGVTVRAALIGNLVTVGDDDAELIFTRSGIPDQGAALQAPQRIGYRLDQGAIVMLRWPALDQAPRVKPVRYPVLEGVREIKFRYLDKNKIWQLQWQYPTLPNNLPIAIEVTLTLIGDEVITRIFALK